MVDFFTNSDIFLASPENKYSPSTFGLNGLAEMSLPKYISAQSVKQLFIYPLIWISLLRKCEITNFIAAYFKHPLMNF